MKIINGSIEDDTITSSSDDEHSAKVTNKQLNADLFLTYEQWTNYMIDKVRRLSIIPKNYVL